MQNTYLCNICYKEHFENNMISGILNRKNVFWCSNKCKYSENFTLEEYTKNKLNQNIEAKEVCMNGTCGGGKFYCDVCSEGYNGEPFFKYFKAYESCDIKKPLYDFISEYDYIKSGFFKFIEKNEHMKLNLKEIDACVQENV